MVDILDMEDIIETILIEEPSIREEIASYLTHKLIKEVADFVDHQKNIACNNCKGKKFKTMKEPWQAM